MQIFVNFCKFLKYFRVRGKETGMSNLKILAERRDSRDIIILSAAVTFGVFTYKITAIF